MGERTTDRQNMRAWKLEANDEVALSCSKENTKVTERQTWIQKLEVVNGPVIRQENLIGKKATQADTVTMFAFNGGSSAPVPKQKHAYQHHGFNFDTALVGLMGIGFVRESDALDAKQATHARKQCEAFAEKVRNQVALTV